MGREKGGAWHKREEEDFPIMTKGFLDGTKRNSRGNSKGDLRREFQKEFGRDSKEI